MLTKTLVLLMDLLTEPLGLVRLGVLMEGRAFGIVLSFRAGRTEGELGVLARDGGGNRVFREEPLAEGGALPSVLVAWDFPPRRNPLPLNGMTFRMSCDPETGR